MLHHNAKKVSMAMQKNLWSISALAVEFGLDRRTVAQRLMCIEPTETKGRAKRYALQDAAKAIIGQIAVTGDILSYDEARARKMAAEAELAEIELQKERGDVLSVETINEVNNEIFGNFRAKLLALPAKSAPDIFASSNVKEAKGILRKSVNDILEELSDSMIEVYDLEDTEFTSSTKDNKKRT